jgi:transposase
MGTPGVQLNKDDILAAIKAKKGIISDAAKMINCDRATIYDWQDRDPEVAQAVKDARAEASRSHAESAEKAKDLAWNALHELLIEKDNTSVIFTLKTLGKVTEQIDYNIKFEKVNPCEE